MTRSLHGRRGSSVLEFTLAGIPMIFVLISTFEMARGMWIYHTLSYAIKEGTRYAIVHGQNCGTAPNACTITVAQIAGRIHNAGSGLLPDKLSLTLSSSSGDLNCRLSDCLQDGQTWPIAPANAPGMDIEIDATYPFQSAISMLWPGTGPGIVFGSVNFPARSREKIQF